MTEENDSYKVMKSFLTEVEAMEYIEAESGGDELYITKDMFSGMYDVVRIR